ncbi:hypothetical protein Val02_12610 [Virgisporangium aliadipatigenens]|uniref:Uncharacterized protein n=1 Tax=Virgisporangium aliadipatigenens TaxID=741659 RepID=A0A8J3YI04_9ACTN|nr:hypothetical protein [Virgisporangium aliadipatigenens]GIJ44375.1 hypothetical protein Val02_12610 [Virgisporangium aliadipatigenens]
MTFPPSQPGRDDQPHDNTMDSLHTYFGPQQSQQPGQYFPPPGDQSAQFPPPTGQFPPPGGQPGQFPPPGDPFGQQQPGAFPGPPYNAPPPQRPGTNRASLTLALVVVLLVVACCGYGGYRSFGGGDDDKPKNTAAAGSTPTASPTFSYAPPSLPVSPTPARPSTSPPPPSPTKPSLDDVKEGGCLHNNGSDQDPDMIPADCVKGNYKVLKRLYGTIDPTPCQNVSGYNTHYTVTYYRNGIMQVSSSYVFCMKKL